MITASSLFITLVISSVLILLFYLILTRKMGSKLFRIDFLSVLVFFILLRIFIPIEIPFTITVPFPVVMNPIWELLNYEIIYHIKIMDLLIIGWLLGVFIGIVIYVGRLKKFRYLHNLILEKCEQKKISDFLDRYDGNDFAVYISPYISSPMVLGFKESILLPDIPFSKKELRNILLHEAYHIKSHDIYIKQVIKLLTIIYWWFPPIYLLQNEIDLFLELRADSKVITSISHYESLSYAETLISVQRKISNELTSLKLFSTCLLKENKKTLSYRIHYLLEGNFQKKTSKLVLLILLFVPILSNSIILEPYYSNSPVIKGTIDESEFQYIIHHKDGRYSLVVAGQKAKIDNIYDSALRGLKIVEEE